MAATITKLSLVTAISIAAAASLAQPTGKVYRIGYLSGGSPTASARSVEAFRQALTLDQGNYVVNRCFRQDAMSQVEDMAGLPVCPVENFAHSPPDLRHVRK